MDEVSVTVSYGGSKELFDRGVWAHYFGLRHGADRGSCAVLVSEELVLSMDRESGDGSAAIATYRAGLKDLEDGLRAGVYTVDKATPIELAFGMDHYDRLVDLQRSSKQCAWQAQASAGPSLQCLAAASGSAPATGEICGLCAVPDDRERCSDLVHVRVAADDITDWEAELTPELLVALCDIGERREKGARCGYHVGPDNTEAWNRECWKHRVFIGSKRPAPPEDIADRLCDEIDHFALLFRTQLGGKAPWPIKQARSIGVLFSECPDLKTLMANIAALGDLLDGLKAPQKCSVDHQGRPLADEHGKPLGQLQLLKRLMETHYPAAVPHAEMLLTIRDARNGWPTHSQSRIVATFKSLSIDYPPHDFTYAWRQMMANLHRSLKGIREAMQRGRVDPSEPAGEA